MLFSDFFDNFLLIRHVLQSYGYVCCVVIKNDVITGIYKYNDMILPAEFTVVAQFILALKPSMLEIIS